MAQNEALKLYDISPQQHDQASRLPVAYVPEKMFIGIGLIVGESGAIYHSPTEFDAALGKNTQVLGGEVVVFKGK